ncbi:MAG: Hsp20/alpha crystallin family protein [Methanoregula sp.]
MVWRRYPFELMWREMDDMRREMENLFVQVQTGGRLLPAGGMTDRMLPAIRGEFRVDVREDGNEVIVVADLPGIDKADVSLRLANPRALEISCERKSEREEKNEGYYMRERLAGLMQRIVVLPADVTEEGAKASFKNGVLEVHLTRASAIPTSRIEIE